MAKFLIVSILKAVRIILMGIFVILFAKSEIRENPTVRMSDRKVSKWSKIKESGLKSF